MKEFNILRQDFISEPIYTYDELDDKLKEDIYYEYCGKSNYQESDLEDIKDDVEIYSRLLGLIVSFNKLNFNNYFYSIPIIKYKSGNYSKLIYNTDIFELTSYVEIFDVKVKKITKKYLEISVEFEGFGSSGWWNIAEHKWENTDNQINSDDMVYFDREDIFLSFYSGFVHIAGFYTTINIFNAKTLKSKQITMYKKSMSGDVYINSDYSLAVDESFIKSIKKISSLTNENTMVGIYEDNSDNIYLYDSWSHVFKICLHELSNIDQNESGNIILELTTLYENENIAEVLLDNNINRIIFWDSLIDFLMDRGYFHEEIYNEFVNENDDDDDENSKEGNNKRDYWEHWDDIELSFQENFVIVGLYNAGRQGGILAIWDAISETWFYAAEADYLYTALILKEQDVILHFCYVHNYAVEGHHVFLIGSLYNSDDNNDMIELELNCEKVGYFDLEEYKITQSAKVACISSSSIKKYGAMGIYYSDSTKKVYFYDSGNLFMYDVQYLIEIMNDRNKFVK